MLSILQIYQDEDLVYEAETDDPFAHMLDLKSKTFSGPMSADDKEGWEFYRSPIRNIIKNYYNNGGILKINNKKHGI